MFQGFNKKSILTILIQLILVVGSCIAAYHLTRHFNIIPKSIIHLPEVYVSHSDLWNIATIFVITFLIQIVSTVWYFGTGAFTHSVRFSNEYVCYLFSYTTASLYLFLATTINYDPQLIAGFGLISTFAYLIAYAVSQT